MNHTIKGILIVAVIMSMLIVGAASMVPIMQNSFASKKPDAKQADRDANTNENTNTNTNKNSADSTSSSSATAENTNNINNTACTVAVTCPEGSTTITSTPPSPSPTTTLQISKHCDPSCSSNLVFPIAVTGNNPEPSSFRLRNGESQTVTLGSGSFTVIETLPIDFKISFSGDCTQSGPTSASGIIGAGQTLTCTIMNHQQG